MLEKIFVIVPFFNEEKLIANLINALKNQTDQTFHVIFVNNNSTDSSLEVIKKHQKESLFSYEIIEEKEKGTGSASDTGFRYAIDKLGAVYLARTDADCLPNPKWIAIIRKNLIEEKFDFIGGIIKPRNDDYPLSRFENLVINGMVFVSDLYGKFKFGIIGYKYIFFMVAGNNLAITSHMYQKSGGFPRTSIDTTDEDLVLAQRVRKITSNVKRCREMIVYNSTRRLRAYGHWNTLMWYNDRAHKPEVIDIR
mgnify:CR=1 FL=1